MSDKLIWVDEEFADKYNAIESDTEKIKVFEVYLKTVSDASKKEFKANLESLKEDVAIYTGLMLHVKQAFGKAKNEQLLASYKLWEKFEKDIPKVKQKVDKIINAIDPITKKTKELEEKIKNIQTWNIEKFIECIEKISGLYGKDKKMFEFLVNNFKEK